MLRLRRLAHFMEKAIAAFSILNLGGLLFLTLYLIVARYLLNRPAAGASEVVLLAAMQLYMSGALLASIQGKHIRVDLFESGPAGGVRSGLVALTTLIVALFFCFWSLRMLSWGVQRPQVTPSLGMPLWIPQASMLFCAIGCLVVAMRDVVMLFFRHEKGPL